LLEAPPGPFIALHHKADRVAAGALHGRPSNTTPRTITDIGLGTGKTILTLCVFGLGYLPARILEGSARKTDPEPTLCASPFTVGSRTCDARALQTGITQRAAIVVGIAWQVIWQPYRYTLVVEFVTKAEEAGASLFRTIQHPSANALRSFIARVASGTIESIVTLFPTGKFGDNAAERKRPGRDACD